MAPVTWSVSAGTRSIQGVLKELNKHSPKRIGSAITNVTGEFAIQYEPYKPQIYWFSGPSCINLWIIASACCEDDQDLTIIYQSGDVRARAGNIEQYIICLSNDYTDINNIPNVQDVITPVPVPSQFSIFQSNVNDGNALLIWLIFRLSYSRQWWRKYPIAKLDFFKVLIQKIENTNSDLKDGK